MRKPWRAALMTGFIVMLTVLVFSGLALNAFINFDDHKYILKNPHVNTGLSRANIAWAFSSVHASNWHPLTWLSHMLDVELFGLSPGPHHLVNLGLHALNAALVFLLFLYLTKAAWPSFFLALLFALHPLHVESVAWAAERKDTLSAALALGALLAYAGWVKKRGAGLYLAALALFALGLLAKPMVLTLPFVMLLLDYWPLGRIDPFQPGRWSKALSLTREKLPFLALTCASALVTLFAQNKGGAIQSFAALPFHVRAANAVTSYMLYLKKTFLPLDLAIVYPHPGLVEPPTFIAAGLGLASLSLLIFLLSRRRAWAGMGWLWFIGMLVPVIGLVQVGSQALADRYTYLPLIGVFVILVWGAREILGRFRWERPLALGLAILTLTPLAWLSARQVALFKNSITLYTHALKVTEKNHVVLNNMGTALKEAGKKEEAIAYFRQALEIVPYHPIVNNNLGSSLGELGLDAQAAEHYRAALEVWPDYAQARHNLGIALGKMGQTQAALAQYRQALRLDPNMADAWVNMGAILGRENRDKEAMEMFAKALALEPDHAQAHHNLAICLERRGKTEEAEVHYHRALASDPELVGALHNLGLIQGRQGRYDEAERLFQRALALDPVNHKTLFTYGLLFMERGETAKAIEMFEAARASQPGHLQTLIALGIARGRAQDLPGAAQALEEAARAHPDSEAAYYNLAVTYSMLGRAQEAEAAFKRVLTLNPEHMGARMNLSVLERMRRQETENPGG